jgi:tRNA-2-methylthio-N6-dimethylallyladenosine synthase
MNRGYTTQDYLDTVARLRSAVGDLAITTDMMVGFPSETEEEFEESLRLYERIGFDAAFMFAYSPRPGTAAAAREDQVPRGTRSARLQRLIALQNGLTIARNEAEVGRDVEVLVDGPAERGEGLVAGRARSNKLVIFPGGAELVGSLVSVKLTEAHLWGFRGEIAVS